jgi:hypothetical protein
VARGDGQRPHGRHEPSGPRFAHTGPYRGMRGRPRPCGVCGKPASRTILIAVSGLVFLKDLCLSHLAGVIDGAREPLEP